MPPRRETLIRVSPEVHQLLKERAATERRTIKTVTETILLRSLKKSA